MPTYFFCLNFFWETDIGLYILQDIKYQICRIVIQSLRKKHGHISSYHYNYSINQLRNYLGTIDMPIPMLPKNGFNHGLDKQFVRSVSQNTSQLMVCMLKNELQSLNIIIPKNSRMNINIIEFDIDKSCSGMNLK